MMEGSRDRTAISNPRTAAGDGRKRKRGPAAVAGEDGRPSSSSSAQWRTEAEQKSYTSKLLDALRCVHAGADPAALPRSFAFREAADHALAVAARGRTRWSRALLSSRSIVIKVSRHRRPPAPPPRTKRIAAAAPPPSGGRSKKKTPALRRKAMVLGCLVPGCRKLSFPSLLEETTDYIAALEMQVRTMAALAKILSSAGSSPASSSAAAGDAEPQPPA